MVKIKYLEQQTTADSSSSHTFFTYFLRALIYFLKGTKQGVESVHDFFYTRKISTLTIFK